MKKFFGKFRLPLRKAKKDNQTKEEDNLQTKEGDNLQAKKEDHLQAKLKKLYSCQDTIPKLIEGEEKIAGKEVTEQSVSEYYVKLQMVVDKPAGEEETVGTYDKVVGTKKAIEVANIFNKIDDQHPAVGKILLLGAAGVGKTTLLHYMSYYWGKGKWDNNNQKVFDDKFEYLFRVRLKTLLNENWSKDYSREEKEENLLACFIHRCLKLQISDLESTKKINKGDIQITQKEVKNSLSAGKNNSKILLMLDGYDEMSSLENNDDRRDEYRNIIDSIFEYQNVVMTSRPNAINDEMQARFERQIANEGLDLAGVKQYVELNFREDAQQVQLGKTLENFLSTNSNILDMCKIPINTALLCLIWHDQQVRDKLTSGVEGDQCNTGLLYREVILWLGRRYSKKFDEEFAKRKLSELSDEAILTSPMLDILRDVAYTGFNEGKVKIDGETFKTGELAIAGKIVDHLRLQKLQQPNNKLTISDITKYGLLRAEGDIDQPIKQNYYFIHLTFQEYLTACYLKDHLASIDQKTAAEAASLIANYRNDPKYLMTLKFLSGLVTSEQGENSQELVTRFWEAVTCNIDGVIELGVETKINLLMHLLGQAKVKREIDDRIPNREQILQLIDTIILGNLSVWGNQIKDSNYINDNIKQRLLKGIVDKNNAVTGRYIEIVSDLINKFNSTEQEEIITRLQDIICKETVVEEKKDWQLIKQAINGVTKIATQVKLSKENVEILVELLMHKIIDANYTQDAMQSIVELLSSIKDQILLKKTVIDQISKFEDSDWQIKKLMQDGIIKLVNSLEDKTVTSSFIDKLIPLLADRDEDVRKAAMQGIATLVNSLEDKTLTSSLIDKISLLLANKNYEVGYVAIQGIATLVNSLGDKTLTSSFIDKIIPFLGGDDSIRKVAIQEIATLVNSLEDKTLTSSLIYKIIPLLADGDEDVRKAAIKVIATLVNSLEDKTVTSSFIDKIIPLLANKNYGVREPAIQGIATLVNSLEDKTVTSSFIDKLIPLLADKDEDVRKAAIQGIATLVNSLEDKTLTSSFIDKISPLLADKHYGVSEAAIKVIATLVNSLEDKTVTSSFIDKISPLLEDKESWVRKVAIQVIATLVNSPEDKTVISSFIDKIIPLLEDKHYGVSEAAIQVIATLVNSLEDKKLIKMVINQVSKFLTNTNHWMREGAVEVIAGIFANSLLPKEEFIRCLNHHDKEVRDKIVDNLIKSFKDFLEKIQLLEKLTKGKQELQFEIIKEKLFNNNLDQTLQEQIKNLHDLANGNDQVIQEENLTTLKGIILSRINKIGNVKSHELIEIALLAIGNDDISAADTRKKELVQSAREVINRQIEYLSSEGLKWINDHFEDLVKISKDSKLFVRKLYHKILADLESTQDADFVVLKELIIKSINYGMTTSLSKTGEIIFEGKKYILKGDNKDVILEEIARTVINQDQDILARQYREHDPLFLRTGKELEQAAADVKAKSILGDQVELSHVTWRVSLMHLSDHKKQEPNEVFVLLERRDAFGYHIVHKIYVKASNICYQPWKKHPNEISTDFRKEVFGEMEYVEIKPRYYCSIKNKISLEEGTQLIQQSKDYKLEGGEDVYVTLHKLFNNKLYDPTWENIPWKEYVQQESIQTFKKNVLLEIPSELVSRNSMLIDTHERCTEQKEQILKFQEVTRSLQKVIQGSDITQQDKKEMQQHLCDIEQKVKRLETQEIKDIVTRLTDLTTKGQNMRTRLKDLEDDVDKMQNQTDTNNISAYRLDKIIYDNPLLNHTELLKAGLEILNFNQILDLTPQLYPNLVSIAINTDDSLLILAGLLSLTHSD